MLRVTLELVPHGDEPRGEVIGSLNLVNDGTGTPAEGNYWVDFHEEGSRQPRRPFRIEGWPRRRRAWDLVFAALRRELSWRNPYNGFPRDEMLYMRARSARTQYVPVAPFEGFPAQGVHLVQTDGREDFPAVRRASFRWIGDIPEGDALTHAAAQVHHDRACQALMGMKNRSVEDSLEVKRRLETGEPLYRWTEPSVADVVGCVLRAIAEGNLEAERQREAERKAGLSSPDTIKI